MEFNPKEYGAWSIKLTIEHKAWLIKKHCKTKYKFIIGREGAQTHKER